MRRSRAVPVLVAVTLTVATAAALVAARVDAGDDDVTIRPYDGPVWGGAPREHVQFLVRDGVTSSPIAGAIVRRHLKEDVGNDATWGPPRGEWRTDAHGLFSLDTATTEEGDADSHWTFDAPGYGALETCGAAGTREILDLEPARDVHGVLLDAKGAPARDVFVEWKMGIATAPALRVARTDADGRYVFRGVGRHGDVCYGGPGICADQAPRTATGPVDLPPPVLVAAPAVTLRGRIVNAPPAVLDRAVVNATTSRRGPLARVGRDGTFVIEGVGEGDALWLDALGQERYAVLETDAFSPGAPLLWDLGPSRARAPLVRVVVREHHPHGKPEDLETPVRLAFDALADGRRTFVDLSTDADVLDATADLAPGTYRALVVGAERRIPRSFQRFLTSLEPFDLTAAPGTSPEVTIALAAQPRLQVEFSPVPDDDDFTLTLDVPRARRTFRVRDDVFLPADGDAFVRVEGHVRAARVGPVEHGVRRVVVDPRPTATLRFVGLDRHDAVGVGGHERVQPLRHDRSGGVATLPWTGGPGPLRLRVFFDAGGSAETTLNVPAGPGTVLDVDIASLPRRPRGRVEFAGPAAGVEALLLTTLDEDGRAVYVDVPVGARHADHEVFTSGRTVRVTRDGALPAVVRLAGTGPFRLTLPSATLRLRFPAIDDVGPRRIVTVNGLEFRPGDTPALRRGRGPERPERRSDPHARGPRRRRDDRPRRAAARLPCGRDPRATRGRRDARGHGAPPRPADGDPRGREARPTPRTIPRRRAPPAGRAPCRRRGPAGPPVPDPHRRANGSAISRPAPFGGSVPPFRDGHRLAGLFRRFATGTKRRDRETATRGSMLR